MAGASSLLDDEGVPSRRWAELGLVRASDLAGRRSARATGLRRTPERAAPEPTPAPTPEPAPEQARRTDIERSPVLPVAGPLAGFLPWGGLRRGSTVAVTGSTALVLALLAEASRAGSWCALVGLPGVGVQAAAEAGLDLTRTALVPRPGPRPAGVVAALVDGVDLVVLAGTRQWAAGDRQRLGARIRQKGAVLLPVGPWPGADIELHAAGGTWRGLDGDGAGRLRGRRVTVRSTARARPGDLTGPLLLPGPDGACAALEETAPGRTLAPAVAG